MAAKKVDALEEKLEMEVGSLKATIDERFNTVQQQYSSLEAMLLKLTELHLNPPLATSTGHGSVAGESSGGTEPVVGGDTEGGGQKTTSLAQPGVMVTTDLEAGRSAQGTRDLGEPFSVSGAAEEAGSWLEEAA